MNEHQLEALKQATRFTYDLQKLRIQQGNRAGPQAKEAEAILDEKQKLFLESASERLKGLEKDSFKEINRLVKDIPIWETWLKEQKGIGPAMGGVLISSIEIEKCGTPSKLWAWCGLAVRDGQADRRVKGQKTRYNPWLKSKVTAVLGGSLLKSEHHSVKIKDEKGQPVFDEDGKQMREKIFTPSPWGDFYRNYKTRKGNSLVDTCPVCAGAGKYTSGKEKKSCYVCEGGEKKGPFPWAKSDAHLHQASLRYMVKMFLMELWLQWRKLEGLDTRAPYAEEYLGRVHHE